MPELPEVTTTVTGLQKVLPGLCIIDIWTDLAKKKTIPQFQETLKSESFYKKFKKEVTGSKVVRVERRAKNILIHLHNKKTILIHLKMTGHIIYGSYVFNKKTNRWKPDEKERKELHDPFNRFVHTVFTLSNKKQFVMCDSRKFGKITLLDTHTAHETTHLKGIGPEPLDAKFTFPLFVSALATRPGWNIKTVLMDQSTIAGIGNIYSDEMLWLASIHPESKPSAIPEKYLKVLYTSMKTVLEKGIDFGGDSMSDYRDINGARGTFQHHHNAYRKTGQGCGKRSCSGVILRKVINGRSAHFCDTHQKLFYEKK